MRVPSILKGEPHAAVRALQDMPMPCDVLMARLFHLTPAEARLARCLSTGETLEEAAAMVKVKLSRTQLSSLFAKTGTLRHPRLVALLVRVAHLENEQQPAWAAD
jgi:DNA-binding CsgD family transcriptional regulator